jgi:hypothetical protein
MCYHDIPHKWLRITVLEHMSANNEKEVEGAEGNVTLKERGEEEHRG